MLAVSVFAGFAVAVCCSSFCAVIVLSLPPSSSSSNSSNLTFKCNDVVRGGGCAASSDDDEVTKARGQKAVCSQNLVHPSAQYQSYLIKQTQQQTTLLDSQNRSDKQAQPTSRWTMPATCQQLLGRRGSVENSIWTLPVAMCRSRTISSSDRRRRPVCCTRPGPRRLLPTLSRPPPPRLWLLRSTKWCARGCGRGLLHLCWPGCS